VSATAAVLADRCRGARHLGDGRRHL